ncbi:MAG TPA: glycine/sarcosine/betaine reductase selenoprotein B family protein [Candidatus Binataceae bacterium]|nr:glycine/sarcosine/betaine reductase selenoprotein B family protein [Candidatus Binataceae bacterium]
MSDVRIDSYKFLPRSMWPMFKGFQPEPAEVKPVIARVPLREAKVALLTSAGLYLRGKQPSFDMDRERREPMWGDPTFRVIPRDAKQDEIGVAHLHINPDDILADFNVVLPLAVFADLERAGEIGKLATNNYSFMGYQGQSIGAWRDDYGPELARLLHDDSVDLLILAPS